MQNSSASKCIPYFILFKKTLSLHESCLMFSSGSTIPSAGLVQYSDLLALLSCTSCSSLISPPIAQCRKGHLYCRDCRTNNSCRICKQTFIEAPNLALEKMLSLIAFPCKYGWAACTKDLSGALKILDNTSIFRAQGCPESIFIPSRLQHETVCQFRPVSCRFEHHGCQQVFSVKVSRCIDWH